MRTAGADPLTGGARTELERLVRRWQQLPLDQALACVPAVRELAQRYADAAAFGAGRSSVPLPELDPATTLNQLVVTAYDLARSTSPPVEIDVEAELAWLRRRIG